MSKLKLRPYQKKLIRDTHASMAAGHRRPMVVLATGGGKTAVFAWMAEQSQAKGKTVWFLVHRRELLEQTVDTFDRFNIERRTIYIGMVGTVSNRPDVFPRPDLIIFDECHHATAKTWLKILEEFPDAYVIGLTATPTRLSGKPLADVFDDIVLGPQTGELIRQGYLAPYRAIVSEVALSNMKRRAGEFVFNNEVKAELMNSTVYGNMVKTYRTYADGMQAIYFAINVEHSESMAAEFRRNGIMAEHFDGKTPKKKRAEIINRFRNGEIKVLTNVALISEGFDMPACDCVGMMRPTASLTIYLQQVGRALRPAAGKTAVLIDHVGNVNRHGLASDPREWSLTEKVKAGRPRQEDGSDPIRICKECFAAFEAHYSTCPVCGAEYKPSEREIKQIEEVAMLELQVRLAAERKAKQTEREAWAWTPRAIHEARTFYDLAEIGKLRGYKPGWAWHQARIRGFTV